MARGEFQLIEEFVDSFQAAGGSASASRGSALRVGPGDDCAVLAPSREELCVTTDALVEGVHFSRPYFSFEDIGHKALAVNLSDLAAMGAAPVWFLCAIATPSALSPLHVRQLARGMARLASRFGCALAGGNFSRASELSLTLTAAGSVPSGSALLRSQASAGDFIYISGSLGAAAQALARRRKARTDRQRRPVPRVRLGLLARRFATAAIDVSDGFVQDLAHVCSASSVRAEVDVRRLPRSSRGEKGLLWALRGGEDYELILSVPGRRAAAFEAACAKAGEKVIRVGQFVDGAGISLQHAPGRLRRSLLGHDHFI